MHMPRSNFSYFLFALLVTVIVPSRVFAAARDPSVTQITALRVSINGSQTRLIFDARGTRPKQIGPASADGISVFFDHINTRLPDKKLQTTSVVKEVKFRRGAGFFEVLFRGKNASVSHKLLTGKTPDRYSLVLEVSASKASPPEHSPENPGKPEKPVPPDPGRRTETGELFSSKSIMPRNVPTADTRKGQDSGDSASARKPLAFQEIDTSIAESFRSADEQFESCRRNLVLCGPEVIESYGAALKEGPKSSHAPLALYRTGLAHLSMGNFTKADRSFRQVLTDWPDHPIASRCWIGVGEILNKKRAYIEALEAFRSALRLAADKGDRAAAYYELGRQFLLLGAAKEALELLNLCVEQDPEFHTKKPDLIRYLGEAEFALGIFEKSREHLIRYSNIQQSAPDQDMVYAKLGEILLSQGEIALANKMYEFIRKYYTDTEGDFISRIRQAELMEKASPEKALAIYTELSGKELSPNLRRIAYFKLATLNWKKGSLEQGLQLMEDVFQGRSDAPATGEMIALRDRILCDLVKKQFAEGNFLTVVQMHEKYRRAFDAMQGGEILGNVADSYGALKLYSSALEIHEKLLAGSQRKNDDQLLRCALYALRMGDYAKASQFCARISAESYDTRKSEILGHVLYQEQKFADAAKSFSKVLQKQKDFDLTDPGSLQLYGATLFELKKYDEAIPVLQKGLEQIRSEDADQRCATLVMTAKCFGELKQYVKAAEMMEAALAFAREDQVNGLLYEVSKLHISAGQFDNAVQKLNQLLGTQNPFWTVVAQQQLNSIQMAQMNQSR